MATRPQRGHFTELDGMRGVLALIVLVLHLGLNPAVSALSLGWLPKQNWAWSVSVDIFFVLSGFVLFLSFDRTRPGFGDYFTRRVRRLAPVYMIGTVAVIALDHIESPRMIIRNLLMVQSVMGLASINFPAWSVSLELYLPALALPLLPWLARKQKTPIAILFALALLGCATCAAMVALHTDSRFARGIFGLATGMLLARLWQMAPPHAPRPNLVLALFGACILLMAVAARYPVVASLIPVFAVGAIWFGSRTHTILSSAPMQAFGRWSYAIYLLHVPVLALAEHTIGSADHSLWRKAIVIAVTIALSAFTYRFIEAPLMQRSRAGP
ncbi:acyltransferase family protein [Sphingomonas sp. MMS24-J45]|uniref:acyltransferase family protein n=1 Tax=Sphingomonas sp. MMS24-J45 TaxID=3238806 RepID=UPI00384AC2DF